MTSDRNRIYNAHNPAQGHYKRVLCLCSAGLLRSPTTALVLSQPPFNFNTRAAGLEDSYALIRTDHALIEWADEIVCMTEQHHQMLMAKFPDLDKPVAVLRIPDDYQYRDPELVRIITEKCNIIFGAEAGLA